MGRASATATSSDGAVVLAGQTSLAHEGVQRKKKLSAHVGTVSRRNAARKRNSACKTKRVSRNAASVRKHRGKKSASDRRVESAILVFRRNRASESVVKSMKADVRSHGGRPSDTLFVFEPEHRVSVLLSPENWVDTSVVATRTCNANAQEKEILVVKRPTELWTDSRQSGLLAVAAWQAIPLRFFKTGWCMTYGGSQTRKRLRTSSWNQDIPPVSQSSGVMLRQKVRKLEKGRRLK